MLFRSTRKRKTRPKARCSGVHGLSIIAVVVATFFALTRFRISALLGWLLLLYSLYSLSLRLVWCLLCLQHSLLLLMVLRDTLPSLLSLLDVNITAYRWLLALPQLSVLAGFSLHLVFARYRYEIGTIIFPRLLVRVIARICNYHRGAILNRHRPDRRCRWAM